MFSIENIPKNPGCYLFKDKKNRIIYVGKAKNLKNRLRTYHNKKDLDVTNLFFASINKSSAIRWHDSHPSRICI